MQGKTIVKKERELQMAQYIWLLHKACDINSCHSQINHDQCETSVQNCVSSLWTSGWTYWWKRSSMANVLPLTFSTGNSMISWKLCNKFNSKHTAKSSSIPKFIHQGWTELCFQYKKWHKWLKPLESRMVCHYLSLEHLYLHSFMLLPIDL